MSVESPPKRMTRQRAAVAELLAKTPDFRSASQLHDLLAERGEQVALATVYRTLQAMAADGEVDVLRAGDGEASYRRCERKAHHHHLVCRACGATVEFSAPELEALAAQLAARHAFADAQHTLEIVGLCADCAAEERDA